MKKKNKYGKKKSNCLYVKNEYLTAISCDIVELESEIRKD
jgi:hypothetical protein